MRRKDRRGSIERRILMSILWVGITPVTVAVLLGYAVVHEAQRNAVQTSLSVAAQKTANGLSLALGSRLRTSRNLSHDPHIIAAVRPHSAVDPSAADSAKARLLASTDGPSASDGPSHFLLFDSAGNLILSTAEQTEEPLFDPRWSEQVEEASFVNFYYSFEQQRYVATIVAPIYDPESRELLGYLREEQGVFSLIDYALGQGLRSREAAGTVDAYQMAYVSRRGGVLTSYLNPEVTPPLQTIAADPRLQERLAGPTALRSGATRLRNYETGFGSSDVLLAYQYWQGREGGYAIYIIAYRPVSVAFAVVNEWALLTILGGALLVMIFCVIAYRNVHNNIARPIALLNEGAQIIRQGDLELKLKIATGDEIEELASSFNKMALALNRNIRQLEGSEEKYRNLVTSMRDGVYQTDVEGTVTFINPSGAEIFGYGTVEEALGVRLQDLFLEEIDYARISNEVKKQSFVDRIRVWMKRKDGRSICVELSGNSVLDDDGHLLGAEGIFRDVTSSVRLEQQARERAERISAINQIANVINSSLEAGLLHESLIVELRKLADFDYAAVALIDEQTGDFTLQELWPEHEDRAQVSSDSEREACCAAWVARERRCLLVDNLRGPECASFAREFPPNILSCLAVPLYATGRIIGTLNLGSTRLEGFSKHDTEVLEEMAPHIAVAMRNARLLENLHRSLDDVTRAQDELHRANEELKTLDEMKTNLLSNVSHELRTPLVAVMGYTDMIFNRKVGPINDVQAEYLSIILRNVDKLVTLIENLLDFSRLHQGSEKLLFDTFDLLDCARVSMQTVQPVADSRDIRLELVASDEQVFVEGDRGKMGQVFNNLLSNAVKFNHNGGSVTIEIRKREDSVEVSVSDTGIGIPPEALDKVFTRFYQYDSSSTRKYGGTGIGLSIAQDIVRLHGSRLTVTSEVGKGSVFRFTIPLKAEHADDATKLKPPSETRLLIEVVTTDRALNGQLRTLLMPEGMDVVHASNASHAIALAQRHSPDCILVDMEASENGHATLDALLADPVSATAPTIILTNDDTLFEKYRKFIAACIKRGFRKSSLLSSIHYALSQPHTPAEPLGNRILCVDDDPEVVAFITRCLEAEGYAVDSSPSGQDALQRISTRQYGLVLLDIAMPGLDGWEVCRQLRADPSLAGLKIYFVTAKPIDRNSARVQDVNADGFIMKPFRPEDLAELARVLMPAPDKKDA